MKATSSENSTDVQQQGIMESRRKLAKSLDAWFEALPDFLPSDALQEALRSDTSPEKEILRLPSDFD